MANDMLTERPTRLMSEKIRLRKKFLSEVIRIFLSMVYELGDEVFSYAKSEPSPFWPDFKDY